MTPKIFLISAALVLAGGSANAFNIGGMFEKGSQMVGAGLKTLGDTECTASKCGNPNVSPNTVNRCFLSGDEKIQRNPNCTNAFFKTSCGPNSPNRMHYEQACQAISEVTGAYLTPAPRQKMAPAGQRQQMTHVEQRQQMAPAGQRQQMAPAGQRQQMAPVGQRQQMAPVGQRQQMAHVEQQRNVSQTGILPYNDDMDAYEEHNDQFASPHYDDDNQFGEDQGYHEQDHQDYQDQNHYESGDEDHYGY